MKCCFKVVLILTLLGITSILGRKEDGETGDKKTTPDHEGKIADETGTGLKKTTPRGGETGEKKTTPGGGETGEKKTTPDGRAYWSDGNDGDGGRCPDTDEKQCEDKEITPKPWGEMENVTELDVIKTSVGLAKLEAQSDDGDAVVDDGASTLQADQPALFEGTERLGKCPNNVTSTCSGNEASTCIDDSQCEDENHKCCQIQNCKVCVQSTRESEFEPYLEVKVTPKALAVLSGNTIKDTFPDLKAQIRLKKEFLLESANTADTQITSDMNISVLWINRPDIGIKLKRIKDLDKKEYVILKNIEKKDLNYKVLADGIDVTNEIGNVDINANRIENCQKGYLLVVTKTTSAGKHATRTSFKAKLKSQCQEADLSVEGQQPNTDFHVKFGESESSFINCNKCPKTVTVNVATSNSLSATEGRPLRVHVMLRKDKDDCVLKKMLEKESKSECSRVGFPTAFDQLLVDYSFAGKIENIREVVTIPVKSILKLLVDNPPISGNYKVMIMVNVMQDLLNNDPVMCNNSLAIDVTVSTSNVPSTIYNELECFPLPTRGAKTGVFLYRDQETTKMHTVKLGPAGPMWSKGKFDLHEHKIIGLILMRKQKVGPRNELSNSAEKLQSYQKPSKQDGMTSGVSESDIRLLDEALRRALQMYESGSNGPERTTPTYTGQPSGKTHGTNLNSRSNGPERTTPTYTGQPSGNTHGTNLNSRSNGPERTSPTYTGQPSGNPHGTNLNSRSNGPERTTPTYTGQPSGNTHGTNLNSRSNGPERTSPTYTGQPSGNPHGTNLNSRSNGPERTTPTYTGQPSGNPHKTNWHSRSNGPERTTPTYTGQPSRNPGSAFLPPEIVLNWTTPTHTGQPWGNAGRFTGIKRRAIKILVDNIKHQNCEFFKAMFEASKELHSPFDINRFIDKYTDDSPFDPKKWISRQSILQGSDEIRPNPDALAAFVAASKILSQMQYEDESVSNEKAEYRQIMIGLRHVLLNSIESDLFEVVKRTTRFLVEKCSKAEMISSLLIPTSSANKLCICSGTGTCVQIGVKSVDKCKGQYRMPRYQNEEEGPKRGN